MKKLLQRISSLMLAAFMLIPLAVFADDAGERKIYISTADELLRFSDECSLDSWSVGKIVEITADISLEGRSFEPIPTFAGILNGNGHDKRI